MIGKIGILFMALTLSFSCAKRKQNASLREQTGADNQREENAKSSTEKFLSNLNLLMKSSPQNAIYARNILKLSILDGLYYQRTTNASELEKRLSESSTEESRAYLMTFAGADVLGAAAGAFKVSFATPSYTGASVEDLFSEVVTAKAIGVLVVAAEVMVLATEIDLIAKFTSSVSTYEASLKQEEDYEKNQVKPIFDYMSPEIKRGTACNFLKLYQENGLNFKNQFPKHLHSYRYIIRIASEMNLEQRSGMTCL